MHGATIKIVNAQQAKLNDYKNTKLKLLKANAAIWFNEMCIIIFRNLEVCWKSVF